jgi:hypothetical protein
LYLLGEHQILDLGYGLKRDDVTRHDQADLAELVGIGGSFVTRKRAPAFPGGQRPDPVRPQRANQQGSR